MVRVGGFSTVGGGGAARHTELLDKEVGGVIDHADGSITARKLAPLDYITLAPLTSDPPLARGRLWYRNDLGELRWSPDGSTVYAIDPAPVVAKSWSDTSYHYFNFNPVYTYIYNPAVIQLDSPAAGHKRAYEDASTGFNYVHGWYLKRGVRVPGCLEVSAYVGGYHGYNATRAFINFVVADPATFDVKVRNDSVPWVQVYVSMSALGYANGSYGNPFSGYIVFTDPPSYRFSPANPSVAYNLITSIPKTRVNILYGYGDGWDTNWHIWASLSKASRLRYRAATSPPEPEVIAEFEFAGARCAVARWDGEVRLWVRSGSRGLVVPLGKEVAVLGREERRVRESINRYDRVYGTGREPERPRDQVVLRLRTDIADRCKMSNVWRLILDHDGEALRVFFGDSAWDGDRFAYYIHSL